MQCANGGCRNEAPAEYKTCQQCREYFVNRRHKLKARGICPCGKQLANTEIMYCLSCRKKEAISSAARRCLMKQRVYAAYGNECSCCGESNMFFLSIDHTNNDGNLDKDKSGRRIKTSALYVRIIREGFPPDYQILCMNCNCGKARNNGICPHKETTE